MLILGKPKFYFGTGFPTPLPPGWKLKESQDDFAFAIAPDGQEYFLGIEAAYPRRVAKIPRGKLKPGDVFADTETGVVPLANKTITNPSPK